MSHCFAATQRAEEVSASAQILTAFGKRRLKTAVCQPRAKPERPPARLAAGPSGALPLQTPERPGRKLVPTRLGYPAVVIVVTNRPI